MILDGSDAKIPVTILTGFLGSGKTTLLNRLVRDPSMRKALVIINEFGSIGIDHDLMASALDDNVVEMSSGCLCCTIRGDLARTLHDAPWRFAREGVSWFDRVVIETTGLADPAPIIHTVMSDCNLSALYRLDSLVTMIDAATSMATLDSQYESVKQAAVADHLLITKTDLATDEEVAALEMRLKTINPSATLQHVLNGLADAAILFGSGSYTPASKSQDVQAWLNAEAYQHAPEPHHEHHHEHHDDNGHDHHHHHHHDVNRHNDRIQSFALTINEPIIDTGFERWIDILTMFKGPDILRIKGIVNIAGWPKPYVIHCVQHILHPPIELDAWPSEDRRSRIVFITKDTDIDAITGTLSLLTQDSEDFEIHAPEDADLGLLDTRRAVMA